MGAQHLLTLKKLIIEHELKEPDFLMIITAGNYSYKREDNVLVVPIGYLKKKRERRGESLFLMGGE